MASSRKPGVGEAIRISRLVESQRQTHFFCGAILA
jgi:hypothetical protein